MMCALGRIRARYFRSYKTEMSNVTKNIIEAIQSNPNLLIAPSVETEGQFAYARAKEEKTSSKRIRTTFGRIVTRQLKLSIPDHQLSQITAKLVALLWQSDGVKEYFGAELMSAYEMLEKYLSSCMTGDDSCYTSLYTNNPDKVRLLVMFEGKTPVMRGLMWTINEKHYMDRIYGHPEEKLLEWAAQKYNAVPVWRASCRRLRVELNYPSDNCCVPYMDTFTTFDEEPDIGGSSTFYSNGGGEFTAQSTCGDYEGGNERCENCGERCDEDNKGIVSGDMWCQDCIDSNCVQCYDCSENILERRAVTVDNEPYCRGCAPTHDECCECNENHTNCTTLQNGDTMCENCLEDHARTCDRCGEYVKTGDLLSVDDEAICDECNSKDDEDDEPKKPEPSSLDAEIKIALKIIKGDDCVGVSCGRDNEHKAACPLFTGKFDCAYGLIRVQAMLFVIHHLPHLISTPLQIKQFQILTDKDKAHGDAYSYLKPIFVEYLENLDKPKDPPLTAGELFGVQLLSYARMELSRVTAETMKDFEPCHAQAYIVSDTDPKYELFKSAYSVNDRLFTIGQKHLQVAIPSNTILTRKA